MKLRRAIEVADIVQQQAPWVRVMNYHRASAPALMIPADQPIEPRYLAGGDRRWTLDCMIVTTHRRFTIHTLAHWEQIRYTLVP